MGQIYEGIEEFACRTCWAARWGYPVALVVALVGGPLGTRWGCGGGCWRLVGGGWIDLRVSVGESGERRMSVAESIGVLGFAVAKCARAQETGSLSPTLTLSATQQEGHESADCDGATTNSSRGNGNGFTMSVPCKVCWVVGNKTSKEPHRLASLPPAIL